MDITRGLGFSAGDHAGTIGQAPSKVLGWRASRELPEVAVEVRLVVVAALMGDRGQPRSAVALEQADRTLKAEYARQGLRRHPDFLAELGCEVSAARPDFSGERTDG